MNFGELYMKPEGFDLWERIGKVKDFEFTSADKTLAKYNPIVLKDTPELTVVEQLRMYAEHYAPLQIVYNNFIQPGQVWFNDGVFYANEKWLRENFKTFDEVLLKDMGIKA
jgi:hypothetical protein